MRLKQELNLQMSDKTEDEDYQVYGSWDQIAQFKKSVEEVKDYNLSAKRCHIIKQVDNYKEFTSCNALIIGSHLLEVLTYSDEN